MNLKEIKESIAEKYEVPLLTDGFTENPENDSIQFISHNERKVLLEKEEVFYKNLDLNEGDLYFYNPNFEFLKDKDFINHKIIDASYKRVKKSSKIYLSLMDFHRMAISRGTESLVKGIMASHNKPGIYKLFNKKSKDRHVHTVQGICLIPFDFNSHIGNYVKRHEVLKKEDGFLSFILSSNDQDNFFDKLSKLKMSRTFNDTKYPLTMSKLSPSFLTKISKKDSSNIYEFLKIHNGYFTYEGDSTPFINHGDVLFCDGVSYFSEKLVISRDEHLDSFFSKK